MNVEERLRLALELVLGQLEMIAEVDNWAPNSTEHCIRVGKAALDAARAKRTESEPEKQ